MKVDRMQPTTAEADDQHLHRALAAATDTRVLVVDRNVRHEAAGVFARVFGTCPAVVVADERTFAAAGRDVLDGFRHAGHPCALRVLEGSEIEASSERVEEVRAGLDGGPDGAIAVAVGSGTINDLAKLASHRRGRPYMVVATAASMDGYTAFGASITHEGSKQTFHCPAPRAVLADLEVIAAAPEGMNASGYADLLAKNPAGADWLLADALGAESIAPGPWDTVQTRLRAWIDAPGGIASGNPACLRRLVVGLMMTGFAMQASRSSRPASGAEHQFSHLWDMQHHTHRGAAPSHGFKVGIGTLASLALHEALLRRGVERRDVDRAIAAWPPLAWFEERITTQLGTGALAAKAREETRAKYPTREFLRIQLARFVAHWPALRDRLAGHLVPFHEARAMLRDAGCPVEPEQIGITRERLRQSVEQAGYIRRRVTVLDLVTRLGLADELGDASHFLRKTQT
jgi:glycerol-1-phosphate dehydrogenase [NAD(P)+]